MRVYLLANWIPISRLVSKEGPRSVAAAGQVGRAGTGDSASETIVQRPHGSASDVHSGRPSQDRRPEGRHSSRGSFAGGRAHRGLPHRNGLRRLRARADDGRCAKAFGDRGATSPPIRRWSLKGVQEAIDYVPGHGPIGSATGAAMLARSGDAGLRRRARKWACSGPCPPETRAALAPDDRLWIRVPAHECIQEAMRLMPAPLVAGNERGHDGRPLDHGRLAFWRPSMTTSNW